MRERQVVGKPIAALRQLRNPEASKEQFQQACADAQLTFVDSLPDKYNTFVGAGLLTPLCICCLGWRVGAREHHDKVTSHYDLIASETLWRCLPVHFMHVNYVRIKAHSMLIIAAPNLEST